MAAVPKGFNANDHKEQSFAPLPVGKYEAMIVDSEEKANSAGTGTYHKLKFQIVDGPHKGRVLFVNLNMNNPNRQAVEIANAEFASICRACGIIEPNDTVELHNLPIVINVKTKKRKDSDEIENVIRGYAKKGASTATVGTAAGNPAPWRRQ